MFSKFEGTTLGILTGGAERGSMFTDMFGGEKQYGNKVLEPFKTLADNSKAQYILGWNPKGNLPLWIEKYKQELENE